MIDILLAADTQAFQFDLLHETLIGAIVGLSGVVSFLFYRLEASRQRALDDAREDAACDARIAESLAALAKQFKTKEGA